jgi:hypothetical protein
VLQVLLGYRSLIPLIRPYRALEGKVGLWDIITRYHSTVQYSSLLNRSVALQSVSFCTHGIVWWYFHHAREAASRENPGDPRCVCVRKFGKWGDGGLPREFSRISLNRVSANIQFSAIDGHAISHLPKKKRLSRLRERCLGPTSSPSSRCA